MLIRHDYTDWGLRIEKESYFIVSMQDGRVRLSFTGVDGFEIPKDVAARLSRAIDFALYDDQLSGAE